MVEQVLAARCVLVVEDEYVLADELRYELTRVGAYVAGPVGHLQGAIDLVGKKDAIDVAVLDVNLRGEDVFPVADLLAEQGVPLIFVTGYDAGSIPPRFSHCAAFVKPLMFLAFVKAVSSAIVR